MPRIKEDAGRGNARHPEHRNTLHGRPATTEHSCIDTHPDEVMLTRVQVAARLAVSLRMVDKLVLEGVLPAYKIGRSVRIKPSDLDKVLTPAPAPLADRSVA